MYYIKDSKVVLKVLNELNKINKTYIVGGYLRDYLMGEDYSDVDLLTKCSFEELKRFFPKLQWTEVGLEFGVCRSKYRGVPFEISFVDSDKEFFNKLNDRDYTINTIFFDGSDIHLTDLTKVDLQQRVLRPVEPFERHMKNAPNTLIRAFRLSSSHNLSFSEELIYYMDVFKDNIFDASKNRLQDEIYKIIKNKYVLNTLFYMMRSGVLTENKNAYSLKSVEIPTINNSILARLSYLDFLLGEETIKELICFFRLSDSFYDGVEKYRFVYNQDLITPDRKDFSFITILKRYQFNNDKQKMFEFITGSNKKEHPQ